MPKVKNGGLKNVNCNRTQNTLSTFNRERGMLAYCNESKINRWMCLLNSGDNINVSFLKILSEIEDNLMNRLELLQNNLQNLTQRNNVLYKSDILKDLKKVGIKLPMKNLNTFITFDTELEEDSEKRQALKCYMAKLIDAKESVTKNVAKIMREIMKTDVEKHYSGYGRMFKGRRKLNFSETNAYLCMQDVLTEKYKKSATQLKILPSVSRWLSQYRDRTPGICRRRHNHSESQESSEWSSE